jgi:DNA-directed RNA polymerase specialized sigma24 family protein
VARIRSRAAIRAGAISAADRDDLIQELLIAFWLASDKFDAHRASRRTFLECVIATRLASAIRTARRRPEMQPLDSTTVCSADGVSGSELRLDVARVLSQLNGENRRTALVLMECSPTEASRALGMARSTVYEHIGRLRLAFTVAGLGRRRGGNRRDRREEVRA